MELLDLAAMKREFDLTWNPVMPLVNALRARAAPARRALGALGRHQQEHHGHRQRLQIRDSYAVVLGGAGRDRGRLAGLARRHRDTVMAGARTASTRCP